MRVKRSSPRMSISVSGPMMSRTSPPEQKLPASPAITTALHVVVVGERAEVVAQRGVGLEGQRVLALRADQRDEARRRRAPPSRISR